MGCAEHTTLTPEELLSPSDWLRLRRGRETPLGRYIACNYNFACLDPLVSDHVRRSCRSSVEEEGGGLVVDGYPRTPYVVV